MHETRNAADPSGVGASEPNGHGPPGRPVASVLVLALAGAFTLGGYEFIRSVSSSLFIDRFGSAQLPIVMTLGPVGTAAGLYAYGVLLSRLGPARALVVTTLASAAGILACYAAIVNGQDLAVGVLYVWRESYIVIVLEQYWSFVDSILTGRQARRLNGPICGVASIGAISGGVLVGRLSHALGTEALLLFAAGSLVPAAALSLAAYRLGGPPRQEPGSVHGHGALALSEFRAAPVLRYLAVLVLVTQVMSTVLDLGFNRLMESSFSTKDDRTAFYGNFYAGINLGAFALQFLAAPVVLRILSLRAMHLMIPCVHLATCALLFVHPTLATGAAAFLAFKALDYSLFKAAKEVLYVPLSFNARYRTKEVIDAFGYRTSKGVTSGALAMATFVAGGQLPGDLFPILGMVSGGVWVKLVGPLTRNSSGEGRSAPA